MKKPPGRIIVVDGYVPDETMNLANTACDLVGVVYRHQPVSSSILITRRGPEASGSDNKPGLDGPDPPAIRPRL